MREILRSSLPRLVMRLVSGSSGSHSLTNLRGPTDFLWVEKPNCDRPSKFLEERVPKGCERAT
jgi:hypothetical protein